MKNVLIGKTEHETVTNGTYNSLIVLCHLTHAAVNTTFTPSAFDASKVKLKVMKLDKKGQVIGQFPINDNLLIVGTYVSYAESYRQFYNGIDKVLPAADVKAEKMLFVEIPFGHTRLSDGESLKAEVTLGQGAFSSAVDALLSYVEFGLIPSIGYDLADFEHIAIPVDRDQKQFKHNLGDNITRIMILNFDKTTVTNPVVTGLTLSSDRLNETMNNDMIHTRTARYLNKLSPQQFATALPAVPGTPTVKPGLNYLPQTHILFDGRLDGNVTLDRVNLTMELDSTQVEGSQNYVVITRYITSAEKLNREQARMEKHRTENLSRI